MNEFVARNGLIALDSSSISGPFVVTGSSTFNGNVTLLGNISSPNFSGNIQAGSIFSFYSSEGVISAGSNLSINIGPASALGINKTNNITSTSGEVNWIYINPPLAKSFAPTSGTATMNGILLNLLINQSGGANGITRGIRVVPTLTSAWDFRAIEWTNNASATSGSWGLYGSGSAPNYINGSLSIGTLTTGGALTVSGSSVISGSLTITEGITGSFFGTSSWAQNAATASSADSFLVRGTLTAQTIVVQTITSSIDFVTGSTRFGSLSSNTHQFTGSISVSGSSPLLQLGSTTFVGDFTNPTVTLGSTLNGFYLDSNRINFKAGGSFAGGFSSDGILTNQILIRGTAPNDLTTAMYIPYRLNAIGLLGGLGGNSAGDITLITSGSSRLFVSSSGNIGIGTTSPAYQVDVTGQARVQGIFYNTGYNASVQRLGFNSGIAASNLGYIIASSNGVFRLVDAAEADFTRLQFGGTTTSFPALQRTGSALSVVDATGASGTNLLVGTTADGGQRLQVSGSSRFVGDMVITGSGATSATNALSIQNNLSQNTFAFRNDATLVVPLAAGQTNPTIQLYQRVSVSNNGVYTPILRYGNTLDDVSQHAQMYGFWNSGNVGGFRFNHPAGSGGGGVTFNFIPLINQVSSNVVTIQQTFTRTSGAETITQLLINPEINQTGGANGVTRGLYVNPTLTAAADWRSIEWSNNTGWGLYGAGTANNYLNGSVSIGTLTTGSALTVSGSSVISGSLVVTQGITASLQGTSSWAQNAISSSFATTSSFASNGGVTQIIAGTNITISPTNGLGAVTINSSGGGGAAFPFTGSAIITGSLNVTGSTTSTLGFTGSLFGTSSFTLNIDGGFY
jgi:hypothetical protein